MKTRTCVCMMLGLAFKEGNLFVADGRANKILQLNAKGQVIRSWGEEGADPGQLRLPHMMAADAAGNLFVAEIVGMRFQKLVRKR